MATATSTASRTTGKPRRHEEAIREESKKSCNNNKTTDNKTTATKTVLSSLPARHAARVASIKSSSLSQVVSPSASLTPTLSVSVSASAPLAPRARRPAGAGAASGRLIQVRPADMAAKDYLLVVDKLPRMVCDFDHVANEGLGDFLRLSSLMGEKVLQQSKSVEELFSAQRAFLLSACSARVPAAGCGPRQAMLIEDIKAAARSKPNKAVKADKGNEVEVLQLDWIARTIPAMGWVVIRESPASFIVSQMESGQGALNALRAEGDSNVLEWTKAWLKTMHLLADYVAKFHPNGLVWNSW